MRHTRSLSLKRETLSDLTPDQLSGLNAGSHACGVTHGPSFDESCPTPTLPVNVCLDDPLSLVRTLCRIQTI